MKEKKDLRFIRPTAKLLCAASALPSSGLQRVHHRRGRLCRARRLGSPGARTLEGLNLTVDSTRKKLVAAGPLPVASASGKNRPANALCGPVELPYNRAMPKSKILIADDNVTNVELLEAYLDGLDCEIAVAVDGRDTLAKVAEFQPDLILLDVMMPKLSGFEVCKTLKRDPQTRQILILMVTALNELGDIERAVAAGSTTSSASRSTSWNCSSGWKSCSNFAT